MPRPNGFSEPVQVNVIMEEWLLQHEVTEATLLAFHDYPENPELLTAWVDATEKLDNMPIQEPLPLPGADWGTWGHVDPYSRSVDA